MNWLKSKKTVAVHDGHFHADDVFAVAIVSLYLNEPVKVFRTRDTEVYKKMDYLLDVGLEYDPAKNHFDHHQVGGAGKRENGLPYATCGLVWKEFGDKISGSKEVAKLVDSKVIQSVDAMDSGVNIHTKIFDDVEPYYFLDYIISLNPFWNEKELTPQKTFEEAVEIVKAMIKREIAKAQNHVQSKKIIKEIYDQTEDKRLMVFDFPYAWRDIIMDFPEPLIVVRPVGTDWWASCVGEKEQKFKNRISYPAAWAGKTKEELAKITGVPDAIFCHQNLFLCTAKSKTGAIVLAKKAIELAKK